MASPAFDPANVWERLHAPEVESLSRRFHAVRSDLFFLWWRILGTRGSPVAARAYLCRELLRAAGAPPPALESDRVDVVFVVQYPKPAGLGTLVPIEREMLRRGARTHFWVLPGAQEALTALRSQPQGRTRHIADLTGLARRPTLDELRRARTDSSTLLDALASTGATPTWLRPLATALFLKFHTVTRQLNDLVRVWPRRIVFHNDFPTTVAAVMTAGPCSVSRLTLQHGIPSREQTPAMSPWYGVWGPYYERLFSSRTTTSITVGCPRFDIYAELDGMQGVSGDSDKAILILGQPITPDLNPRVRCDIAQLARSLLATLGGFRVILRLHPADTTRAQAFRGIPGLRIESGGSRSLLDAVREAEVVIATPTTGLVEAVLLGTPACAFCPTGLDPHVARALPPSIPRARNADEVIAVFEEMKKHKAEWIAEQRQVLCESAVSHVGSATKRVADWLERRS